MKYYIVSLLICALLASSTVRADDQSPSNTIKLGLFEGSNPHWIAINVQDGSIDTTAVQMRDNAEGAAWADMHIVEGWAHWVINSAQEYIFPLSFRVTSKAEQEIVVEDIITELGEQLVDTGAQYSVPREARRKSSHGTNGNNKAPTTAAPKKTSTSAPKTPSTSAPKTPSTTAPKKTSTSAPKTPSTTAPKSPSTTAPKTPTTAPSSSSSGSSKMGLLVPLYTYPGSTWDTVAASGKTVKTVAVINPNSGPGTGPDSTYNTYMNKLDAAGVEMIGYVHTSYGARAIADVKADIAKYASEFPLVVGIFIDEAAVSAAQVSYYTQVHQYIMSMPGYKYNVLNPGTVPVAAYLSISTQIVSYESTTSGFASSSNPSFGNAANKDHFSVIGYSSSQAQMVAGVAAAKSKGYYGWVYFTDGTLSGNTYGTLPSYYAAMASAIASA